MKILITLITPFVLFANTISMEIQKDTQRVLKGKNSNIVRTLYVENRYNPFWIEDKEDIIKVLNTLSNPLFNYKNKEFDRTTITKLFYLLDTNQVSKDMLNAFYARIDIILTNSFVRLVRFVRQGDVDWQLVEKKLEALKKDKDISAKWEMQIAPFPSIEKLFYAIKDKELNRFLYSLIPMKKRYLSLNKLLYEYKSIGKLKKIPFYRGTLKFGMKTDGIRIIKQNLKLLGDFPKDISINKKFDMPLREAILKLQKRYLIKESGNIDSTTIYYLNISLKELEQKIITNLDKTKLYFKEFEETYIEINIPEFNMRFYEDKELRIKNKIVVGRIDRPTPIFSDSLTYMVLNPTWTIPNNLIKRDLIPTLKIDPNYLEDNDIHAYQGNQEVEVDFNLLFKYEKSKSRVPYRFVQHSGNSNGLGRIKYMFPNRYAVYLHDTNNKSLFEKRYRVYSSGCMRLQKPFDLFSYIIEYSQKYYVQEEIEDILDSFEPTTIKLKKAIPVHILYFTVFVEENRPYFRHDIYLYDKIIEESVDGNKKENFKMPKKRMIKIKSSNEKVTN